MKLLNIFKFPQKKLKAALVCHLRDKGYSPIVRDGFVYAKGEIPVLLVAHMDTVHKHTPDIICMSEDKSIMMSPFGIGGDDRCGIAMILEVIKELRCHVLFTEDEEVGGVGAGKFCKSEIKPEVNFIIEFDRANENDAVYYQLDNEAFAKTVEKYGFVKDYGSYSDIVDIAPELGCAAVNLSCGYYNAHTQHEFVSIPQMYAQVERAKNLIANECENFFEWREIKYSRNWCYGGWYDDDYYGLEGKSKSKLNSKIETDIVRKEVSLIPDDAYLYSADGMLLEVADDPDTFFIDKDDIVYQYDDELLMVVPLFEFVAINSSGMPCKMEADHSFMVDVEYFRKENKMPNHVTNRIKFIGNQEKIYKVLQLIRGDRERISFDKIIPMPDSIYRGTLSDKERELYGINNWYDWRISHWGTKWDAYNSSLNSSLKESDNTLWFDTAWSCPIPVLQKLAEVCCESGIDFEGEWADEDCGRNAGSFWTDNQPGEPYFSYVYADSNSDAAYDTYVRLKGESRCLGKDNDGHWVHYDCDTCPNRDRC